MGWDEHPCKQALVAAEARAAQLAEKADGDEEEDSHSEVDEEELLEVMGAGVDNSGGEGFVVRCAGGEGGLLPILSCFMPPTAWRMRITLHVCCIVRQRP